MFNNIFVAPEMFLLTLGSFFFIFAVKQLFIKVKSLTFVYHTSLFCILFVASIGGGSVQNDGYARLKQYILLEKNNQLELAKQHPQNYDSMLAIDLNQFKSSDEFEIYIKNISRAVDMAEAISIGWLFAFIAEISLIFAHLIRSRFNSLNSKRDKDLI